MPSAIDITKPIYGTPTTQSVRDNFHIARDEITALQDVADTHVNRDGDTMTGPLILHGDPQSQREATTLEWVLKQLHSTINTLIYVGEYDGANDVILSSNQAQFVIGTALPPPLPQNSQFYFTVKTTHPPPGVGNQPPEGVTAGTMLLSNGVVWINYATVAANVSAKTVPIDDPAIPNVPGLTVYDALTNIGQDFLQLDGGTMTGDLILYGPPLTPLSAATKQFVEDFMADSPNEAPLDGFAYARFDSGWTNFPRFSKISIDTDTWNHISLNSSIASNTANQIIGRKDNIVRWAVHVGNNAAGHDFDIWRYNDAGAAYDSMPVLTISRASGSMILRNNLFLDPPTGGAANLYGRGINPPADVVSDSFNIYARSGGINTSAIALRGPTFPGAPNSVELFAGQTNKAWTFKQDGHLYTPGGIYIVGTNQLVFGNTSTINWDGSNFVLRMNADWQMYCSVSTGQWTWDGYPNHEGKMTLSGAGALWTRSNITTGGSGILYTLTGAHSFAFGWNGNINCYVDGGYQFDIASTALVGGKVSKAGDYMSGYLQVGSALYVDAGLYIQHTPLSGAWAMYASGNERIQRFTNDGWATRFDASTGHISHTDPAGTLLTQSQGSGVFWARGIFSFGAVYAGNDWSYYMGLGGLGKLFHWTNNYYLEWNSSNGVLSYVLAANIFWVMRNDWWAYNNSGPVAGHGWVDLSDSRAKENIIYVDDGLETIMKLKPAKYIRRPTTVDETKMISKSNRIPQEEMGFIAQDVLEAMPFAVYQAGMDLPNGEGGMDTESPSLGIMTSNILAAAVNAIKELTSRVTSLEASAARRKTE